jgi:hypothetical protein
MKIITEYKSPHDVLALIDNFFKYGLVLGEGRYQDLCLVALIIGTSKIYEPQ